MTIDMETDVLVIGSGPAGGGAALALATLGVDHMVITKYSWTANTPRAHITNQRTVEIFRDLGIEEDVLAQGTEHSLMGETVFCTSLAGDEIGRVRTWGTHPAREADYTLASPSPNCDIPQTLLEPIVIGHAASRGSKIRFDTEYVGLVQDADGVDVTVRDRVTGREYRIRAKYVVGADGGRSAVAADIGLPFEGEMDLAGSMNIVFHADLSHLVDHRPSVLYWVLQPGADIGGIGLGLVRMVRPWNEWLIVWGYDITQPPPEVDDEMATKIVHELLGDNTVPVTIRSTSLWGNNKMYATRYRSGRVFCMGDAVHRHPPSNGLGSNTSIQDAYNLAWKLAYVLRGTAGEGLLDSYDAERAPVGKQIVLRANKSIEEFGPIFDALGLTGQTDAELMTKHIAERAANTPEAAQQRAALREALELKNYEFNAHGVELGQRYASAAVVPDGTAEPEYLRDRELYYHPTTWPGARLPHVWLGRGAERVSTHDLAGKGRFCLLTGISGEQWADAAATVAAELGVEIAAHVIGPGRDHIDLYEDWARARGGGGRVCARPARRPRGLAVHRSGRRSGRGAAPGAGERARPHREPRVTGRQAARPAGGREPFDGEADVVVVGGGGGGLPAALFARWHGDEVILLEKADEVGGTAKKAAFWYWVPNNAPMRAAGLTDDKADFLRYVARLSRPTRYDPQSPTLGLTAWEHAMAAAIYDSASPAAELLAERGALPYRHCPGVPDYWSELPEDKAPYGRVLVPLDASESMADGGENAVRTLSAAAARDGVNVRTGHRVQRLIVGGTIVEGGRVVGVEASTADGRTHRIGARKAVIFATGGFTHDDELRTNFLGVPAFRGCAAATNEGDFVRIASAVGAQLRNMNYAWMCPVPLERSGRPDLVGMFSVAGDSMLFVDKTGRRVVNEKLPYNELAQAFFRWDGTTGEYPHLVLIQIWDQRSQDHSASTEYGRLIVPPGAEDSHVISGATVDELTDAIAARLAGVSARTGGVVLAGDFATTLRATVARFNALAATGRDDDFHRGDTAVQQLFNGPVKEEPGRENPTMWPLAEQGPFYAALVTGGTLDTKGGPQTNVDGQVLDDLGEPIPGLYGAGNCVASASAQAYWAGGATLGPILAFAHRAALAAHAESPALLART